MAHINDDWYRKAFGHDPPESIRISGEELSMAMIIAVGARNAIKLIDPQHYAALDQMDYVEIERMGGKADCL